MSEPKIFYTYAEAQIAVNSLGIKTITEYNKRYKEDPKLPSVIAETYKDYWNGSIDFFSNENNKYKSYEEAKNVVHGMGFRTHIEYRKGYKIDTRLPYSPNKLYKDDWVGWKEYLGAVYISLEEAKRAALALGIRNSLEYRKLYKLDYKLPGSPNQSYSKSWINWTDFLETKTLFYFSF